MTAPRTPFKFLNSINSPDDLRQLKEQNLPDVAHEIRQHIIQSLNQCGGHFGANLCVVDSCNYRLQLLSPHGEIVRTVGRPGARFGELSSPSSVAHDPKRGGRPVVFSSRRALIIPNPNPSPSPPVDVSRTGERSRTCARWASDTRLDASGVDAPAAPRADGMGACVCVDVRARPGCTCGACLTPP